MRETHSFIAWSPEGYAEAKRLQLQTSHEKLRGLGEALGPSGLGSFLIPDALSHDQLRLMRKEIFDPFRVPWRDNHDVFVNDRGMTVVENHDVFALKRLQGDKRWVERVPGMDILATSIQSFVRDLAPVFPSLAQWQADEMSLHRYDDPHVGLSFHKDNLRFSGVIAVLTLEGESDFVVLDAEGARHIIPAVPGGLILSRANGLYPVHPLRGPDGKLINICPDHAVLNLRTPYRTSFIVRDNARPNEAVPGFEYDNWAA